MVQECQGTVQSALTFGFSEMSQSPVYSTISCSGQCCLSQCSVQAAV